MLSREDTKVLQNIIDEIIENKDSEPFRAPVDYKGTFIFCISLIPQL